MKSHVRAQSKRSKANNNIWGSENQFPARVENSSFQNQPKSTLMETQQNTFFNHLDPESEFLKKKERSGSVTSNISAISGSKPPPAKNSIIKQIIPRRSNSAPKNHFQNHFDSIPNLKSLIKFENINEIVVTEQIRPELEFYEYKAHREYTIESGEDNLLFTAGEFSECYRRKFCGSLADLVIVLNDFSSKEKASKVSNNTADKYKPVLKLIRPLRCSSCWFFCCLQKLEVVEIDTGVILAELEQKFNLLLPVYEINFLLENRSFKIEASLDFEGVKKFGVQFIFTEVPSEEIIARVVLEPAQTEETDESKEDGEILSKEDGLKLIFFKQDTSPILKAIFVMITMYRYELQTMFIY